MSTGDQFRFPIITRELPAMRLHEEVPEPAAGQVGPVEAAIQTNPPDIWAHVRRQEDESWIQETLRPRSWDANFLSAQTLASQLNIPRTFLETPNPGRTITPTAREQMLRETVLRPVDYGPAGPPVLQAFTPQYGRQFDWTNLTTASPDEVITTRPVWPAPPRGNRITAARFGMENPDTTPVLMHRPLPRDSSHLRPHERFLSPEDVKHRANWSIAKVSRTKRDITATLFKTCMMNATPYTQGKSYKFTVDNGLGIWHVMNQAVLYVDLYNFMFVKVVMPRPSRTEPKPGVLNLTRFLLRMFGIGAVRRKDQSVITTATTSKRLSAGETWIFKQDEIKSFGPAPRPANPFRPMEGVVNPCGEIPIPSAIDVRRQELEDRIRLSREEIYQQFIGQPMTPHTMRQMQDLELRTREDERRRQEMLRPYPGMVRF